EIPNPQRDINVRSGALAVRLEGASPQPEQSPQA
ncbi:MAG: hypothetical protein JWM26_1741, partial [Betaproteobacteria bacterium]|nr:hypothetical protein [Betaproteobacteria bacterium]